MDLLDLDEELIDTRLKAIMNRSSYTDKHLKNAIYLLQYKNMINLQEGTECENDAECTFIAKLLANVRKENIDDVCIIVNIILGLNKSTVVAKSEHLIQQILSNIALPSKTSVTDGDVEEERTLRALIDLKLCESILDAIIRSEKKLTLPFLETPLENVLASADDKLKVYFLNNIVPKIFQDKDKIFTLKQILHVIKHVKVEESANASDIGRFRNAFYEKACEVVRIYLEPEDVTYEDFFSGDTDSDDDGIDYEKLKFIEFTELEKKVPDVVKENLNELINLVEHVIDCGGYGCLKWILKIMLVALPQILNNENTKFKITQFIDRMWREIEELRSNNQYVPCMVEFTRLITHEELIKRSMYNNVVVLYCSKIIEYGHLKNCALSALANEFHTEVQITENMGHMIHILCNILLFSPVPQKENRISDNVAVSIENDIKFGWSYLRRNNIVLNSDIQVQALGALTIRIEQPAIYETIASFIISKIDNHFKTKERYHGNSHSHRILLLGLQHLLFLPLLNQDVLDSEKLACWMIDLLGKIPHQPSVRICLEWFIALRFHVKHIRLDETLVEMMKLKNIPITSQFMILYWTLKHKLLANNYTQEDFENVMDLLLSHTMGQMFNIRLHAQYLATEILNTVKSNGLDVRTEKYAYTSEVIQKTFGESAKDKNFVKLKEDFFVNEFDIVQHYSPCFIFYFLPRYCEVYDREEHSSFYITELSDLMQYVIKDCKTEFKKEWFRTKISDDDILKYKLRRSIENSRHFADLNTIGTIQKKYIPWKNMSDIDVFETEKKKETSGELIVVASLIDKLPNLGGMARTSEVFGVKTYVIDSLRHLQDKTFQGLSVSAERWINVEEVRPGPALKEYLMKKKTEGYSVVAAEQTSTSVQLQKFNFPKKTLLLLGHEKEGVPCDLLPMMDHCVEIPQQGVVRSLNVHVTAAIFVWEYSRQNVL
ncbi:spoU rRNA methylase family domain-containing protein [Phthorimaea operculella]|nr:spoU rRNA methylase family domain-containing protein [Phthorimaea operculella]